MSDELITALKELDGAICELRKSFSQSDLEKLPASSRLRLDKALIQGRAAITTHYKLISESK